MTFTLSGAVGRYITIKLKHSNQNPVAVNKVQLKGMKLENYNFQNDGAATEGGEARDIYDKVCVAVALSAVPAVEGQ